MLIASRREANKYFNYYRERKMDDKGRPYTQKAFAKVLGISDIAVRGIENRDAGMDFEHRQFLCKLFNSEKNIARIETIFQQLQQSPYKHSPDVARLEYLLYYRPRA